MPEPVVCPSCRKPFSPPAPACPGCGLSLTGPAAAELWETDQQLLALQQRRSWLISQLQPEVVRAPSTPVSGAAADVGGARPHSRSWSGQQLLLVAGALLLLTAAVVFLAVAWSALGVGGQVGAVGVLTTAAAASALVLSRRGLGATAETSAGLAVGLAVLGAGAAYTLDLAGVGDAELVGYSAVVAALLGGLLAGLAALGPAVRTFSVAAVVTGGAAPGLALVHADGDLALSAFVLLLTCGCCAGLALAVPDRWSLARRALAAAAASYLLLTWSVGLVAALSENALGSGGLAVLVSLAGAVLTAGWAGLQRGFRSTTRPLAATAAVLAAVATVTGFVWHAEESGVGCSVLAGVTAVVVCALVRTPWSLSRHPAGVAALLAQLVSATALVTAGSAHLDGLTQRDGGAGRGLTWWALVSALAVAATAASVMAVSRAPLRPPAAGYAATAAVLAAAVAVQPSGSRTVAVTLVLAAAAVAVVAGWRRDQREEEVLAAVAAVFATVALVVAVDVTPAVLALTLALTGLTGFGYGVLPGRGLAALLGVAGCSAALWVLLADGGVDLVEAYSLPLAALIGVVGWFGCDGPRAHRRG